MIQLCEPGAGELFPDHGSVEVFRTEEKIILKKVL